PRPVKARVTCNGASVLAEADGTFTLAVPQAKQYRRSASASPVYNEQSATFSDALGTAIELNFVSRGQAACAVFPSAADVECSILSVRSGAVHGSVAYDTGGMVIGAQVVCQNVDGVSQDVRLSYAWPAARTDTNGSFTITTARPGRVACVAYAPSGDAQRQEV